MWNPAPRAVVLARRQRAEVDDVILCTFLSELSEDGGRMETGGRIGEIRAGAMAQQ